MAEFRSLGAYSSQLTKLASALSEKEANRIAKVMGEKAQAIAHAAAVGDLGGDIMHTGKGRGWQIPLVTQLRTTREAGIVLLTPTRHSAGPWTVAEQGRNQGNASGFAGPGVNRRTGETSRTSKGNLRKVRAVQAKRWNGTTTGKGTATSAQAAMGRELPKVAEAEYRKVLARFFDVS